MLLIMSYEMFEKKEDSNLEQVRCYGDYIWKYIDFGIYIVGRYLKLTFSLCVLYLLCFATGRLVCSWPTIPKSAHPFRFSHLCCSQYWVVPGQFTIKLSTKLCLYSLQYKLVLSCTCLKYKWVLICACTVNNINEYKVMPAEFTI